VIQVIKQTPNIGAEIRGVDVSKPLDESTFAAIVEAFHDNAVVFFRKQTLDPETQIAFSRRFGDLEPHMRIEHRLARHPELLVLSNILDENGRAIGSQDAGRMWHSDESYKRAPARATLLYGIEIPIENGKAKGNTWFANTAAAYDALSADMKARVEALTNIHSYADYRAKNRAMQLAEQAQGKRAVDEHMPDANRLKLVPDIDVPIVRVHPFNGRKCLFINEAHTSRIPQLPEAESEALLHTLYEHIVKPEFLYCHEWQPGDLLMWDNCLAQHRATFDYDLPLRRLMHRTTVRGPAMF